MKKEIIIFAVILSLLLNFATFGNFATAFSGSSKENFINQYNEQHIKQLLNKAYLKAVLILDKKNLSSLKKQIKPNGGSFETEYFDHYDFESGYRELRGYLIDYCVYHQSYPYTAHFKVDQIRSYSGSISVDGNITASLKDAIIGGISASLGYQTTFDTGYQTNVTASTDVYIPAKTYYTISAWYPVVFSSGIAYYRWYDVTGNTGISARPCGAETPLKYIGGNVIYFDGHPGREP